MIHGGCLCNAVRYASPHDAIDVLVCHCRHCQKQSGSAFSVIAVVAAHGWRPEGETLSVYADCSEAGNVVRRMFCNRCGSALYSEAVAAPGLVFVKAGTLDDPAAAVPTRQIWCRSAQPWWLETLSALPAAAMNPTR